jgi:uncharacterized repeat protein (TIGR01451 family)
LSDTTFSFLVRPTASGVFRIAAQLTTATSPDPDSSPNTGTADGEDDVATAEFRVGGTSVSVFESPNPNQRLLPPVAANQPATSATQADLSLQMTLNRRTAQLGDLITCTLHVTNRGGATANNVQLQDQLPDGFQLTNSAGWVANGRILTTSLPAIPAGTTARISFQIQMTLPGLWINKAQISASASADPDSTPGNGFTNGEDDQTQVDVRSY